MLRTELELTDRSVDLVHERIDLSIRIGRPEHQSYVLRELCPIRGLLVASPAYLEANAPIESPGDLRQHECVAYRGVTAAWRFASGETIETTGRFRADNGDALRHALLGGLGLGYLPSYLVGDDVRAGRLVPVLPEHWTRGSTLYACYPESRHLSPKVRAMIDWLVEEFHGDPEWDRDLPYPDRVRAA